MSRLFLPPAPLTQEELDHISEWPEGQTEIDRPAGLVWFYDDRREFVVAFGFDQIRAHAAHPRGQALNFARMVRAQLESTRKSHEQGGRRVTRTWRSPTSVVRP